MAKKIAIIFFAFVFVYSYLLYYTIACFQLSNIKNGAEELRHEQCFTGDQLVCLSFKKTTAGIVDAPIKWHSEEEFYYQEKLYDVMRKEETKDSISFYCISDDFEEELMMELKKHIECFTHDSSGEDHNSEFKFLLKDFICQIFSSTENQLQVTPNASHACFFFLYIPSFSLSLQTPPPKHFLS